MARSVVKGPLAFTVGADAYVEDYDSSFVDSSGGTPGGFVIARASNDMLCAFASSTTVWVYRDSTPTYSGDHYAKVKQYGFGGLNTHRGGVACRISADTGANRDWYAFAWDANVADTMVYKCVNNSISTLNTDTTTTWADGDTIELEAVTNGANCDLLCYKNGTLLYTITDSSSPLTGGKPGFYLYENAGGYQVGLDDLELGDITGGGSSSLPPIGFIRSAARGRASNY